MEQDRIAEAFVSARRAARGLSDYPGNIPESLKSAYSVQDVAIRLQGDSVAGWKVGRIMPPLDAQFGADRLAGPIFVAGVFFEGDGKPVSMAVFQDGFGAVEAEFLLRIGTQLDPAKRYYSLEEAADAIDAVHVGLEIASSPLGAINDLGPAVTASDFGNNNGLVIGAAIPDWQNSGFATWPVTLAIDGAEIGTGRGDSMPDGPVGAARFLFELMARRGIALQKGQWISSGAITGVHRVAPGASVEARFGADYAVRCTIEAATAR
ncbi:2-keto-4-pentenoate hydratase [Sphingomonas cavernae]|uniref:2-keto-4-pentenoate hydratase n=1 Tax=Sphingomonas cavernae TaxID=2320861 RepID=A0A418WNI2_9SPHN|nr:2-keto-4-pentenoate hydratase [Sphingomonas cavernae]